jgi:hypothetical protein
MQQLVDLTVKNVENCNTECIIHMVHIINFFLLSSPEEVLDAKRAAPLLLLATRLQQPAQPLQRQATPLQLPIHPR